MCSFVAPLLRTNVSTKQRNDTVWAGSDPVRILVASSGSGKSTVRKPDTEALKAVEKEHRTCYAEAGSIRAPDWGAEYCQVIEREWDPSRGGIPTRKEDRQNGYNAHTSLIMPDCQYETMLKQIAVSSACACVPWSFDVKFG